MWVSYLDFGGYFPQVHIAPASLCPVRDEGSAYASIQHYEFTVSFVQIILGEDLGVSAYIIAIIWAMYISNVIRNRNESCCVGLTIKYEDEVRGSVQPM